MHASHPHTTSQASSQLIALLVSSYSNLDFTDRVNDNSNRVENIEINCTEGLPKSPIDTCNYIKKQSLLQ